MKRSTAPQPTDLLRTIQGKSKGIFVTGELKQWWKGLGKELETDIETLNDSRS